MEVSDGSFYGTTSGRDPCGGAKNPGTIFNLEPDIGLTILHWFAETDGSSPSALIQGSAGSFYGTTVYGGQADAGVIFRLTVPHPSSRLAPGDCNLDGSVDIADAICLLGFLFLGSPARLPCGDGTRDDPANRELFDWNGDAGTNIADAVDLLGWLFRGGPPHVLGSDCRPTSGCPEACPAR